MMNNTIYTCQPEVSAAVEVVQKENGLWANFLNDGLCSFGLLTFLLVVLALIFSFKNSRRFVIKHLKYFAIAIFLLGVLLYGIGFNEEHSGCEWNFIALGFRSILSSLEMFISHSDLIEVDKVWHHCPIYMTAFSLVHFLAVLISAIFVVQLLGFRFISWLRMLIYWFFTKFGIKYNLYIFWGLNDVSFTLAKDIIETEKQKKQIAKNKKDKTGEKYKIIFITTPSEESSSHNRFTFSHFFSGNSHGKNKLDKCEDLNASVVYSSKNLSTDEIPTTEGTKEWTIFSSIGLKSLGRLVKNSNSVKFFFLSDKEEDNSKSTSVIRLAASKGDNSLQKKQVDIYCHARRDNQNIILENMALDSIKTAKITIHIIDSSYLSVLSLKMNPNYHPVNFVETNTLYATVKSAFTALVVGFGETGQDAFKFLYEFGAFVGEDGLKSPFKCYAIDQHMDALKGNFYMKAPALVDSKEVKLLQCSNLKPEFWNKLRGIINELNYVVIALGDDQTGISLAIDLYEFACRYRENNLERFKIFVRSYRSEYNIRLKEVAKYYNDNNPESHGEIVIFGTTKDIFTYDMVVNDKVRTDAMGFMNVYEKNLLLDVDDPNYSTFWDNRHNLENTIKENRNKENPKSKPVIKHFAIQLIKRTEFQDMANAYHAETKLKLAGIHDSSFEKIESFCNNFEAKVETPEKVEYPKANKQFNDMMTNLAKCEHLRWNASHEAMGYVRNEDKSSAYIIAQKHNCLASWEELGTIGDYKKYDYNVVETSFKIKRDKLKKSNTTKNKEEIKDLKEQQ